MAYFLKKSKNKKGLYLQIYESHWDAKRGHTVQSSIKALGYEHELQAQGISNPVEYYKDEVARMNTARKEEREKEKVRRISDTTPEVYLGHFLLRAVNKALNIEEDFRYLQMLSGFKFDLYALLSNLAYARVISPASKLKTYTEVLPQLAGSNTSFSLDQLYDGISFLGQEYQKVVEMYNHHVHKVFGRDLSYTYFDCTNFFFEVDLESDLKKKGPSKEQRRDPIVGMGLLLDAKCIPLGLIIYPGNESEKPVMRKILSQVKRRNNLCGRTIRVADKGLNCADNIADALACGDGYIFSKSIKQLPELEQAWALSERDWKDIVSNDGEVIRRTKSCIAEFDYNITTQEGTKKKVRIQEKRIVSFNPALARKQHLEIERQVEKARRLRLSQAKRSEFGDSAKFVNFTTQDESSVLVELNYEAIERAKRFAGYNMIVTSEAALSDSEIYDSYHELWHIEETFRALKSGLSARPVYMQKDSSIIGHFLICYISILLERLVQVELLNNRFATEEIIRFIRNLRAVEISDRKYINLSKSSVVLDEIEHVTKLALGNYYLTKGQVKEIIDYRI